MKSPKETIIAVNTIATLVVATSVVMAATFILFYYLDSTTGIKDAWSTISGFFGGFATLTAAYIASRLFNDWKDEKNYELESKYLVNTLLNLDPIFLELMLIRSNSNNLKKIDRLAILKTDYLNSTRFDMFEHVTKIYPDLKIYCDLTNDNTLINLYNLFDKQCFILDNFKSDLFYIKYQHFYNAYLKKIAPAVYQNGQKVNSSNKYRNEVDDEIQIAINNIKSVFEPKALATKIDGIEKKVSYEEWIESTINLLNQIQDYCIKQLRPKSN